MKTINIPFRYGYGKRAAIYGKGEKRAIIQDTINNPFAFEFFRKAVKETVSKFSNPDEAYNMAVNYFLGKELPSNTAEVQEFEFGEYLFRFLNIDKLHGIRLTLEQEKVTV